MPPQNTPGPGDQQQQTPEPTQKASKLSPLMVIAILLVAGAALAYVFMGDRLMAPESTVEEAPENDLVSPPPPPPSPPASPDATGEEHTVSFTADGYEPKEISVALGDTVTFVNNSDVETWPASAMHPTHTVYAGTSLEVHCAVGAVTGSFDACHGLAPGESWSFTFDKAGSWGYHDHLAARNTGRVIVE